MAIGIAFLATAALLLALLPGAALAGSKPSWDGIWVGKLNNSEPVSVTILGGKVVSYAIRGGQPFGIGYRKVTMTSVSFGDHGNYDVKITKTGKSVATGLAHSPMGDGSGTLNRQ